MDTDSTDSTVGNCRERNHMNAVLEEGGGRAAPLSKTSSSWIWGMGTSLMVKFLGWGGVGQALAEVPDGDNVRWNNTALSSSAGTCFPTGLWLWQRGAGGAERGRRATGALGTFGFMSPTIRTRCSRTARIAGIRGACRHDVEGSSG
jgi:hypothetical protein